MENATFNVPSITCNVCSGRIKNGLKDLNGIENVDVDLKAQAVNVAFDPLLVSPSQIRVKIASLGYEVVN